MNRAYYGWLASATVAGGLTVTLVVARFGTFAQPGRTAAVGCLVAAAGVTGLSLGSSAYVAALFAVVQGVGIGIGIFTSHRCSSRARPGLT